MFNVTILRMKDIVKYAIVILVIITMIVIAILWIKKKPSNKKAIETVNNAISTLSEKSLTSCLDQTMPLVANVNEEYRNIANETDASASEEDGILEVMLKSQIGAINSVTKSESDTQNANSNPEVASTSEEKAESASTAENENQAAQQSDGELAPPGSPTTISGTDQVTDSYNVEYGKVKIKNETSYTLTEEMMNPDITIDNKNIILFHTHSCESYTPSEQYPYTPTGNFRTTDLNYTVTRVGTELETQLKKYNYNVIHSTDYHDYPSYNGSYTKSLQTVENILKTTPADIIMDVHRDAIGSKSDYAPTVKIGDTDVAARIMFVIGTNGGGLWHPNWNQNLKFAIKIQQKAEEMYPGLFKPLMLTNSRYNQHTGKYASIIEVGATGNTLEQCLTSMKYLAKVMNEVLK